jgi:probable phosphoglycerate mutase
MKKHFYIFRHGQTIWNAEGRPQGQHSYPVPLTIVGIEQAKALSKNLKDKRIKKIVSSDLLRAEQTAKIVAEGLGVEIEFDSRFREVDYGKLNGLYTIEKEDVYPDFKLCYKDYGKKFPEGESLGEVADRMIEAIKDIAKSNNNRNWGISTHGNAITVTVNRLFDYKLYRISNCDYIHITYDDKTNKFEAIKLPPEQGFELSFMNDN